MRGAGGWASPISFSFVISFSFSFAFAFSFAAATAGADEGRLERAEHEMERGHRLMEQHDYAGALTHFEAARALAPDSSGPYLAVGLANSSLGRCDRAVPALQEYLRRKTDSPSPAAEPALLACRRRMSPPPPPPANSPELRQRGTLHIESLPIGAEVRLDEPEDELAGRTPLDLAVAPGSHRIFLSHDGYRAASFDASVSTGVITRVTATLEILPPPSPIPPPPSTRGRMELFVGPTPVSVLLNGARMPGSGPNFGAELPGGLYRVVIEKQGHEPEYRDVWVRPGETTQQRFTFSTTTSVARHRAIVAVSVLVPLVVVGLAVGLGVGLTQGSSSSSSGKETNLGTVTVP